MSNLTASQMYEEGRDGVTVAVQAAAACICRQWCRDMNGQVIDGRRYPSPNHADGCPAQVRERFVRVAYHGHSCVIEPHEVDAMKGDVAAGDYAFTDVLLTRDQFERMDEFTGF